MRFLPFNKIIMAICIIETTRTNAVKYGDILVITAKHTKDVIPWIIMFINPLVRMSFN